MSLHSEVTLTPWSMSDAPRLAMLMNDPLVLRYLTHNLPNPYRREDAEKFISNALEQQQADRAILYHGEVVGGIGARPRPEKNDCMLGYWLGSAWQGRGIATRALRQYLELLPTLLPDISVITACIYAPNIASKRLLLKLGFTCTGSVEDTPPAGDGNSYPGLEFRKKQGR